MSSKIYPVLLIVLCTLFTSSAQILYKIVAGKLEISLTGILLNYPLILGLVLYAVGSLLIILAFRRGEVSVLYPILSLSFVWVNIGSYYFFGEALNMHKWAGIGFIILGIVAVNWKGGAK